MTESGKIFMLARDGSLAPMQEHQYDSEELLQGFLEQYPDLLGGDQINPEDPRRWLLIRREMAVPDEEGATGRWSLDHLFVDQDGVPTLVECKRSSDTRTRREVVGQMLDYAANAISYWPVDRLRQYAAETATKAGQDADTQLLAFLEQDDRGSLDAFWENVERNLKPGRVRLIFASDQIPRELRSIVEFLNLQMERAEVLAVEVKQYAGAETRAFSPRVLGMTEAARQTKQAGAPPSPRRSVRWSVDEVEANVERAEWDAGLKQLVRRLIALARQLENEGEVALEGGAGQRPSLMLKRGNRNLLTVKGEAAVTVYYGFWHLPDPTTAELRRQLSVLLGNSDKVYEKEPNIASLLEEHDPGLEQFREWVLRVLAEFKRAEQSDD